MSESAVTSIPVANSTEIHISPANGATTPAKTVANGSSLINGEGNRTIIASSKQNHASPDSSTGIKKESKVTSNGDLKSPLKIPNLKKEPSSLRTPTKSLSPKSPESCTGSIGGQERKKVPMNKIQVGAAPSPNLKVVRSKIGSLENSNYKPGGGKVKIENKKLSWNAQPRIEAKNQTYIPGGGDKKIEHKKLQWNAKSKIGSLENSTHKPGGGEKKIESVKLDFKEKAKPKIGSKDNIKHIPGGGTVKTSVEADQKSTSSDIEEQKLEIKAQSKIGSLDNVKHKPGGGEKKIFDDKTYLKQGVKEEAKLDNGESVSNSPKVTKKENGIKPKSSSADRVVKEEVGNKEGTTEKDKTKADGRTSSDGNSSQTNSTVNETIAVTKLATTTTEIEKPDNDNIVTSKIPLREVAESYAKKEAEQEEKKEDITGGIKKIDTSSNAKKIDGTNNTKKVDSVNDNIKQIDPINSSGKVDLTNDTEKVNITNSTKKADLTNDTEKVNITNNTKKADLTNDTKKIATADDGKTVNQSETNKLTDKSSELDGRTKSEAAKPDNASSPDVKKVPDISIIKTENSEKTKIDKVAAELNKQNTSISRGEGEKTHIDTVSGEAKKAVDEPVKKETNEKTTIPGKDEKDEKAVADIGVKINEQSKTVTVDVKQNRSFIPEKIETQQHQAQETLKAKETIDEIKPNTSSSDSVQKFPSNISDNQFNITDATAEIREKSVEKVEDKQMARKETSPAIVRNEEKYENEAEHDRQKGSIRAVTEQKTIKEQGDTAQRKCEQMNGGPCITKVAFNNEDDKKDNVPLPGSVPFQ